MDNLSDIVTLIRVVESGSFVSAAQGLGVTPSAVSKSVSRLEEKLGVRLLNRTTRSLSLTDAGNDFFVRTSALGSVPRRCRLVAPLTTERKWP